MKSAVIQFPGSNCDRDAFTVMRSQGLNPQMVWHDDTELPSGLDLIVLPGGFSYGDYLRCGAMAARSPIMQEVIRFARAGGYVLGICNGFQILCETDLLPGTLMRNAHLKFNCKNVYLRVEATDSAFTSHYTQGQVICLPIAHHEGNYFADDATLNQLRGAGRIALRYCSENGEVSDISNPNGAVDHIAGVLSEGRNVLGLMPHPERHAEESLGGHDGAAMFRALLAA